MSPWRYLARLYRQDLGRWGLTWALLALTWMAGAALLALSGWFIAASALAGLGLLTGLNIFTPSTAIRGLALLKPITRYLERVLGHDAVLRLLSALRVRLFAAVATLPAREWLARSEGERQADLVTRLMQDIDTLDGVPLRVIGPLLAAFGTLLAAVLVTAVWGTPAMALLLALGGLLVFATALGMALLGRRQGTTLIAGRATLRVAVDDHLGGLAELLAYGRAEASREALDQRAGRQLQAEARQEQWALTSEHIVQGLIGLGLIGLVALGWGEVPAPQLALLTLLTLGLGEALAALPGACWRLGEAEAAAQRVQTLETAPVPPASPAGGAVMPKPRALRIDGLLARRQPGQEQPWTARIEPGRPLLIHGASGSGKSSLLETLAGELPPLAGTVWVDERDWLSESDAIRYRRMAYLGQQDHLLDLSVREFLRLGLGAVPDAELHRVLDAVALDEVFRRTGDGLDYRLGPQGARVSGGQARRLQLAALLLRDPDLVLLDEPFRGLDSAVLAQLLDALTPWLADRCCVLVSHAPESLPAAWPRLRWPTRGPYQEFAEL
ncbi:MAG: ATP-binding cassette domain-containing protein [Xanthomonadales bacterium]|jgi:ATP-binding cassette subfamily C protein CydC|nr:ATP-binding cassette domain-containing protein [Xanthomonadales bacterium]